MSDEGITINSTRYSPEAVALMAGRIAELEKANASLHQTVLYWNERAGENYERAQTLSTAIVTAGKAILNGNEKSALVILLDASFEDDVRTGAIDPKQLQHRATP